MKTEITKVDYHNPVHQQHFRELLNGYASDPMGGYQPLPERILEKLPNELAALPYAVSFLLYVDDKPTGLANCFFGFSTFACRPLLNIHDFVITHSLRNKGLSQVLLQAIEDYAKQENCCKVTLEVLSNNKAAQQAYKKFGFAGYELTKEAGTAEFWQKTL